MGRFAFPERWRFLGWLATLTMLFAVGGMFSDVERVSDSNRNCCLRALACDGAFASGCSSRAFWL